MRANRRGLTGGPAVSATEEGGGLTSRVQRQGAQSLTDGAQGHSVGERSGSGRLGLHQTVEVRLFLIKSWQPDLGWTSKIHRTTRSGWRVLGAAAPLDLTAGSHRRRGQRPWQGSRDLGKDSGAFRATWRTRPWAQRQREGTRGRRTRWDGPTAPRNLLRRAIA